MSEALRALGWTPFFAEQTSAEDLLRASPVRVFEVQRSGLVAVGDADEVNLPIGGRWFQLPPEARPTVGDWLLADVATTTIVRLLERTSLLRRIAPGRNQEVQPIGANVDVLFVVTSANDEFNESRLERYLSLARDAGVTPVIVITKEDLSADAEDFVDRARSLDRSVAVELVNALDPGRLAPVRAWCDHGRTVALLGSSGVGKSTLVNGLMGRSTQATQSIRSGDDKGRHTTTHRSLHRLPDGGLLLDSPGIRELQLADSEDGLGDAFPDIDALAADCRFADCGHESEPGCAVQAAVVAGKLSERRLENFRKLEREDRRLRETIAERHQRARDFSKRVRRNWDNHPKNRR